MTMERANSSLGSVSSTLSIMDAELSGEESPYITGKGVNGVVKTPVLKDLNGYDLNALHAAAVKGDKEALAQLIAEGGDINIRAQDGTTALSHAAKHGNARCVKLLLSHGAKWSIKDNQGTLPIHFAADGDHRKSAKLLITVGSTVNRSDGLGRTPLHRAVLSVHPKMVLFLLSSGSKVDKLTKQEQYHSLHLAVQAGSVEIVKMILQHRPATLNPQDIKGQTPIHIASAIGRADLVGVLITAGADVNIKDKAEMSPLQYALQGGYEDVCHTLTTNGADVSLRYTPSRKSITMKPKADNHTELQVVASADRYGYLVSPTSSLQISPSIKKMTPRPRSSSTKIVKTEVDRAKKWSEMIKKWEVFARKKPVKIKQRTFKGIPDCVRGEAWKLMAGSKEEREKHDADMYGKLLLQKTKWVSQIDLDVNRSSRNHIQFRERYGPGQIALFNILKAYSVHDQDVGYCQGMSDITALILKYMPEEDAFWVLERLMNAPQYMMRTLFLPGFPRLQQTFSVHEKVFESQLPLLHAHFTKENVLTTFYAAKWFLMAFLDIFSVEITLRIYDLLMCEGYDIVFSIAVGVLGMFQSELLGKSFDKIMSYVRTFETMILDPDKFIGYIDKHRVSQKKIKHFTEEYEKSVG